MDLGISQAGVFGKTRSQGESGVGLNEKAKSGWMRTILSHGNRLERWSIFESDAIAMFFM